MKKILQQGLLAAALVCGATTMDAGFAQQFPNRAIRVTSPTAPGGAADAVTRLFSDALSRQVGQPVIVESRPGAGMVIGARYVVNSAPDGYNLYAGSMDPHPLFHKSGGIDPTKEMAAISTLVTYPFVLSVTAGLPVKTAAELAAYARANPGKLNFATPGNTANLIIFMALLSARLGGMPYTHIAYKGGPEVQAAMINGDAHITLATVLSSRASLGTGKTRALLLTTNKRSPLAADIPTADEVGVRSYEAISGISLWAPLKTPKDIIAKLSSDAAAVAVQPEYVQRVTNAFGVPPVGGTPEEALRVAEEMIRALQEGAKVANFKPFD